MSSNTEFPAGEYPADPPILGAGIRRPLSAVGRRPGNADTRGEIVEAAKRVFAAKGYDGTSLRAVAREAGVDPALVHHYFDGKASLFVAAMALPFDPRAGQGPAAASAPSPRARTIESLPHHVGPGRGLGLVLRAPACPPWPHRPTWPTPSASSSTSGSGASMHAPRGRERGADAPAPIAMVSSQLMGLAFTRYLLRVPAGLHRVAPPDRPLGRPDAATATSRSRSAPEPASRRRPARPPPPCRWPCSRWPASPCR